MSDWTPEFVAAYKRLEAELAAERENLKEALELLSLSRFDAGNSELMNRENALRANVKSA